MTTPKRPPLVLGYLYEPFGSHPSAWRDNGEAHDPFDVDQLVALAQLAEEAKLDFFALGDSLVADPADNDVRAARTEPFTAASFLATRTSRIGLLVTANTSYYEPFNLARLSASLDHVTHGRASWNLSTGASQPADRNYSRTPQTAEQHYARATEAIEVIRKLWDSWEDDAFVRDKETGVFVDGAKIHPVDHEGSHFKIRGPLNVARPPQGQVVLAHEAGSGQGENFAAGQADIVFIRPSNAGEARELRERIRSAAVAGGRDPDKVRVLAEVTPVVAETDAAARELLDHLDRLGGVSAGIPGLVVVGSAEVIADTFQAWAEAGAADGFLLRSAVLPAQLRAFVASVIPELRARGLARADYAAATLRLNLDLPAAPNRLVA